MTKLRNIIRIAALALSAWDVVKRCRVQRRCEELEEENAALRGRQDLIEAALSASLLKPGYGTGTPVDTAVGQIRLREAGGVYEGRGFLVYLPSGVMLPADAAKTVAAVSEDRLHLTTLPSYARQVCEGAAALILASPSWQREGALRSGIVVRSILRIFGSDSPVD